VGLYLCIFDDGDEEVGAVDVGHYSDFGDFRHCVAQATAPQPKRRLFGRSESSPYPVLMEHSDCDGEWSVAEASVLLEELAQIRGEFAKQAARPFPANSWQAQIADEFGLVPTSLAESFIDVDGEPLLMSLQRLAETSIRHQLPISFQ